MGDESRAGPSHDVEAMHGILILIKGLGRGGAEQLLASAVPHFDRSRFDYTVAYLLPHKDAFVPEIEAAGVEVVCLGSSGPWPVRLRRLVCERGIGLVHVHSPVAASAARVALVGTGARIVYTEHNVWGRYRIATRVANAVTYRRNDHVFAVSDHVLRSIRVPREVPTETLYHGPDHVRLGAGSAADGVRAEFGVPEGAPLIGNIANFKDHKGHGYLLEATARVVARFPRTRLLLVGVGPLEPEVRRRARELGIADNVVFAGFRTDVPRLLRSLDAFVLASTYEGLSIALLEAMSLGTCCVVTAVGGLPEAVEHRRSGVLVPPRDPDALAAALLEVISDPALRDALGREGSRAARRFDIRGAVARMEQVYTELLA